MRKENITNYFFFRRKRAQKIPVKNLTRAPFFIVHDYLPFNYELFPQVVFFFSILMLTIFNLSKGGCTVGSNIPFLVTEVV